MTSPLKSPLLCCVALSFLGYWSGCGDPTPQSSGLEMMGGGEALGGSNDELNLICGDGVCHPSEVTELCPEDCAFCGDGICSEGERAELCPRDCDALGSLMSDQGLDGDQGLDDDQGLEGDQGSNQGCGDGVCDQSERSETCPDDCEERPPGPTPDPDAQVIGHVDSIDQDNGQWTISGWACHVGWAPSVEVELYAGGDASSGVLIKRALASDEQEGAVGEVCGVDEGDHRFNIPFTQEELSAHAGQRIFVHAISPVGNENRQLINSGDFALPGEPPGTPTGGDDLPFELSQVTWLHTDVSAWPITTTLSVSLQGGNICLEYDKKNVWPPVAIPHSSGNGDVDVVSNPWVFVEYQGQWFAATWEWMAVNSTCKSQTSVAGDHIKRPGSIPLDWRPSSGQRLYFMISALARASSVTNVQERSQIVEVIWP